jgi:hypothetical protein
VIEFVTRNQIYLLAKDYPPAVYRRMRSRILAYQCLWSLFAIRRGGFGAYLRGLRAGLRKRGEMHRKGAELMSKRRISDDEFLQRIRDSERQIFEWQQSRPPEQRSTLLKVYFRLFDPDSAPSFKRNR